VCTAPHATARGDSPDFSLFSRGWYAHRTLFVVSVDGYGVAVHSQLGRPDTWDTTTMLFDGLSADGFTAYGTIIGAQSLAPSGTPVVFSIVSPHTAYLRIGLSSIYLCGPSWEAEDPQLPWRWHVDTRSTPAVPLCRGCVNFW
jgi:hypothetical protein